MCSSFDLILCRIGDLAMVRFLIEEIGANPNFEMRQRVEFAEGHDYRDIDGLEEIVTPFSSALSNGHQKVVAYLEELLPTYDRKRKVFQAKKFEMEDCLFDFTSSSTPHNAPKWKSTASIAPRANVVIFSASLILY